MVTEHLNFKKTETCFRACLKSHFLYCSQFHNLHVNTTAIHKAAHKAAFINFSALKCGVQSNKYAENGKYYQTPNACGCFRLFVPLVLSATPTVIRYFH